MNKLIIKPLFLFSLLVFLIGGSACNALREGKSGDPLAEVTVIKVECRNETSVCNAVVQVLRKSRVSDWESKEDGDFRNIEARYKTLEGPQGNVLQQELREISGVLFVEVKKDGRPVKNE